MEQAERKPSAPTLKDVAKRAGVSTATVSRCLNEPARVTDATRERVAEAVAALGYSPNFGARALAARRTRTIGAVIPTMEHAIFARALQAFQEALQAKGFTLLVASSSYQPDLEEEQIRALVARGAEGLLLVGHDRSDRIYEFLEMQNIPALIAWAYDPRVDRPSVGFDNRAAMREMAEAVLDQGHVDIGMIAADTATNDRARDRAVGVRDALTAAGANDAFVLVETGQSLEAGGDAFDRLLAINPSITAILCSTDVLAVGAIMRARSRGVDVPSDISITGFADLELASVASPPVTTIQAPHQEMGRRAADMLERMAGGWKPDESVELPVRLIQRGSLAPPKAS